MTWSYERAYVGLKPNFRRLCPFCGCEDVTFNKERYGGRYVFRCWNRDCGATVHFETREFGGAEYAGPAGSVHRWNRRACDAVKPD